MLQVNDQRRLRVLMVAVASLLAASMAMAESDDSSARHKVEEVSSEVVEELVAQRAALRDDPRRLHELVERLILPHFDFKRMSRRVLGKQWKKSSEEQRTRFMSAFRTLLVRTYSTVLDEYAGQPLRYLDPVQRKKENEVVVPVIVDRSGGAPFQVSYAMHRVETEWKVFDVAVDGVSLVTNYRSSFRSEIARHGLDGLIARLEAKNATQI